MTAAVGSGAVPLAGRWRRRAARAMFALVAAVVVGFGPIGPAAADETVTFDDAGDAPTISVLGDSTLAGVRWYADYGELRRFNHVFNAESCRRTIERSCVSREGYRSANVITTMRDLDGRLGQVLVVMSGYNDPIETIDDAIAAVVDEARAQGVGHVVWLSLRTSPDVDYSDPQQQSSINTFREYNEQLTATASSSGGYLQVADWATYSTGSSSWFEDDGVHLTRAGVDAVTTFIADAVTEVIAGNDVSPAVAPWSVLVPGAEGDAVTRVQQALLAAGIDLPGGVDGVYGDGTMIAVAAYQRRDPSLRETGAVDIDTAIALGVYADPATTVDAPAPPTTPVPTPSTSVVATPPVARAQVASDRAWGPVLVLASAGGVLVALAGVTVGVRHRHVIARRAERRWARVHPSTSPGRSVAEVRRSGDRRAGADQRSVVYDHEFEESPVIAAGSGDVPVNP